MMGDVQDALIRLRSANPLLDRPRRPALERRHRLQKVLIANRGEIAKRFFFALKEERIPSVAVVTDPDRKQSWYEFADEVVYIGEARNYTNISVVLAAVLLSEANAVYPGYGFLSESHRFVDAISELSRAEGREIIFIGPPAEVMRRVGNKLDARALAKSNLVPLFEGTELIRDLDHARQEAARIGYPVMVKLNAGGGGKGMVAAYTDAELARALESARRIGRSNYGDDAVYFEKYIQRPVHIEVQIFNGTAVGIRQCAVQRRNQKIIEETGDFFLDNRSILKLLAAAEAMATISGYADGAGAGTVEFLYDAATEEFGFLEINARLQVEYPVTDQSLRIDLAKWQIFNFDGRESEIPYEQALRLRFADKDHAIECRIYAEDPWAGYAPSPGVIAELDLPTFNGIRCDFGFKTGDTILPHYDPMIGKLIARGRHRTECLLRLERALGELYVRGITTNVGQLLKIVRHPEFQSGSYTNLLLQDSPELESPETDAERPVDAAVLCALAELSRSVHEALETALASPDLEAILPGETLALAPAFHAEVHGKRIRIDFVQLALETYGAFVNDVYYGEIEISRRVEGYDDFLIVFRGRSYPVRVDRRPSFHALRVMEEDGRIHYYRIKLQSAGTGQKVDSPGTVRAPFQGSFVKFASDRHGQPIRIGSRVERGGPLIVIEAMKMESVIASPVAGTVTYLVEDGDPARLVRGTTSQGLVVGKALAEGEILVLVEEASASQPTTPEPDPIDIQGEDDEVLARLRDPDVPDGGLADAVRVSPERTLPRVLALVRSLFLGYVLDVTVRERIERFIEALRGSAILLATGEEVIKDILDVYSSLKQIYSPRLGASQTWFGEMNRLVLEWDNETYAPPEFFRSVIGALLQKHGIAWTGGKRTPEMRLALLYILRAYAAVRDGRGLIGAVLELLRECSFAPPGVVAAVNRLVQQEQSERDDALAGLGRAFLADAADRERREALEEIGVAPPYAPELDSLIADPFRALPGDDTGFRERAGAGLRNPEAEGVPSALPSWVRHELEHRMALWSGQYRTERLPSSTPTVLVYRLTPLRGGAHRYASIAWLEAGAPQAEIDLRGQIASAPNLEVGVIHAIRLLAAYDSLERGEENFVEVLACERPVELDLAGRDPAAFNYDSLLHIAERIAGFILHARAGWILLSLDARRPGSAEAARKVLNISLKHGQPCLDLLHPSDRGHPLWNGVVDEKNQKLFGRGKWPAELWAQECFDPGTVREILIDSVDGATIGSPRGGSSAPATPAPVAAKIYEGLMAGRPAVFFLKDSRISGGATGDREGRKYVAACYYAYLRDVPLYVWNDGAGANIRQGILSLNRAAQGFMMNALLGHGVSYERFLSTVRSAEDPALPDLFDELDRTFGLAEAARSRPGPRAFFLTAIGVGSSTGLDVYGSSQAPVQIMLDTEESYRVLTGSNVIRAVTGENLTNYEIGGARVMGAWTGTVDLVARDRIELLRQIRSIHLLFSEGENRPTIARAPAEWHAEKVTPAGVALTERMIRANVDGGTFVPFKGEYVEAGGLVGGFARLGGKHVLVMGPRVHIGIRSFASVVRAKELLQIANRTRSPKLLIFGRKWYRSLEGEDEMAIRARTDVVRLLFEPGPPRVHIITHPEGLLLITLNSQADAVVYVKRAEDSDSDRRLAMRTATFHSESLQHAFDLANRVLALLMSRRVPLPSAPPRTIPDIPAETSRPFDMVSAVIEALLDEGSFLEFHREGRESGGSTLITGLGALNGTVTGVIADQPLRGGAPDAPGTEKFRVFMEFLDRNRIPLVMLSNAAGFVPGTKQERLRIQQIGGESLDINVLSRIPVVSVVLNQNFGGRQIHAFSRFLRPGIAYIALDRALLGVMGAPAAFDLFHGARYQDLLTKGKREDADRMRNEFLADFDRRSRADQDAMQTGVLDWTVPDLADLRSHVLRAMKLAETKAAAAFGSQTPGFTDRGEGAT